MTYAPRPVAKSGLDKKFLHKNSDSILYRPVVFNLLVWIVLAAVSLLPVNELYANPWSKQTLSTEPQKEKTEIYISINTAELDQKIKTIGSVDFIGNGRTFIYANPQLIDYLQKSGIKYRTEKSPGEVDFDLNMVDVDQLFDKNLTETWDFYPTYEAYIALMHQFETDFPDLVEIINIGSTVQGRDLLFARIRPDISTPAAVPQFIYTSTMHGDETAGFVLSLRLIHHLLTHYGVDEHITHLMDQLEIWICPNENPDGTYTNNNATVNGATRANANGIDLNRNYPTPHPNPPWPPQTPIQPETQAMMDLAAANNFIMSANMHGGIELVNYPFDTWVSSQNTHADHSWWQLVMQEYVDTVHAHSPAGYMTGQGNGITHGGDWYVVYGSRQDYFNYFHGCREFTLELSNQKLLNPALLPAHWEYNYRSLINYMKQATYGIHGVVRDATTLDPLYATLTLAGHDQLNSEVATSMPLGNFSRPVLAGSYDLVFSAEGQPDITYPGLTIDDYERIDLSIHFSEDAYPLYIFSQDITQGRVTGKGIYASGQQVQVEAIPAEGYRFVNWQTDDGQIIGHDAELTFTMPQESHTLYASFEEPPTSFAVVFAPGEGNGTVSAQMDDASINSGFVAPIGSDILFVAEPALGYKVDSWIVNDSILTDYHDTEYMYEDLQSSIELITNFTKQDYTLTVTIAEQGSGQVAVYPDNTTFQYGESITLNATPADGFSFLSWANEEGEILSQFASWSFSMPPNNLSVVAVFELLSGFSEELTHGKLKIFPNPTRNHLALEAGFEMVSIEITDEQGRVILSKEGLEGQKANIDLAGKAPGFYFVRVFGKETNAVKKLQIF